MEDVDEYLDEDEEEADETSSFNGEEDVNTETLTETEKDYAGSISGAEKEDYSDGWLYEDTLVDEVDFCSSPSSAADEQNESSSNMDNHNGVEKDSTIMGQSGPHVKTSAITGVGLQELMELIDKKLSTNDEKLKGAQVVERNFFDRKWRPSHTQDSSIAVEQ